MAVVGTTNIPPEFRRKRWAISFLAKHGLNRYSHAGPDFDPYVQKPDELEKAFAALKAIKKTEHDNRILYHVHACEIALGNLLKALRQRALVAAIAEQAAAQHQQMFINQHTIPDPPQAPVAIEAHVPNAETVSQTEPNPEQLENLDNMKSDTGNSAVEGAIIPM
ncbi:hypothetical protein ACOME3_007455 [Neoechinorhynchus agilis]